MFQMMYRVTAERTDGRGIVSAYVHEQDRDVAISQALKHWHTTGASVRVRSTRTYATPGHPDRMTWQEKEVF